MMLSNLLIEGHPADYPVAIRHRQLVAFKQFKADVTDAAARFKDYRKTALVCHDSYNFMVGFFGLLHAGATVVLPPNNTAESLNLLKDEFDSLVNDAVVEDNKSKAAILTQIDPARLSLLFLTSGTTGTPKKISKSLEMLEKEILTLNALWGNKSGGGPIFSTVSHQHIYGLTFKLLWPLMTGRPFISEMYDLWENLLNELVPNAVIISSPAHLSRLGGLDAISPEQRPQQIFSAGAPLSLEASQQTKQIFGCYPTEIFGSTETGAIATRSQTSNYMPWKLLPGITMRSDDEGRLAVCSPFIGDEWLETSDIVEAVADGFHYYGRADRIAKIEGKRISLVQIEQSLTQLSFIKAAAVIVINEKQDRLGAAIVLNEEGIKNLNELGNFRFGRLLRNNLAKIHEAAAIPRLWRFVKELPVQGLGKRRDADIRALFSEAA